MWLCCSQIPVPVFLPTTLQSAEHIVKTIDELKAKVPTDPLEADLIAMAEMIAEEDKKPACLGEKLFLETNFLVFVSWAEHKLLCDGHRDALNICIEI